MKKFVLIFVAIFCIINSYSQQIKTVDLGTNAGTLSTIITVSEKSSVTKLIISGNIDARDFRFMRDDMANLKAVDLSGTVIKAYNGLDGTNGTTTINYAANTIPIRAFYEKLLNEIVLPEGLLVIDEFAIYKNTALKELILPESLLKIERYGIRGSNIKSVTIPNNVHTIGNFAFLESPALEEVIIGNGVTTIGNQALSICPKLKVVYVNRSNPPSLNSGAFTNTWPNVIYVPESAIETYKTAPIWSTLTTVYAAPNYITIESNGYGTIESSFNSQYPGADKAVITKIKLVGLVNSTDITFIRTSFPLLVEIDLRDATLMNNTIPDNAFASKATLTKIYLPNSIEHIGASAFQNCGYINNSIALPENLVTIGSHAFQNCSNINIDFNFPATLTAIGNSAFRDCESVNSGIKLPEGLTTIGQAAFEGCKNIVGDLIIPNSVITLGNEAFKKCQNLNGILKLSNQLVSIGSEAFYECRNLKGIVEIPEGVEIINSSAFNNCNNIDGLIFPASLTSVAASAFQQCSVLKYIKSNNPTPPTLNSSTFASVNKTTTTVIVPLGSKTSYQAANYWKDFANITTNSIYFQITVNFDENEGIVLHNLDVLEDGQQLNIELNESAVFHIASKPGYIVKKVTYNGVDVTDDVVEGVFTTNPIYENGVLDITFKELIEYEVAFTIEGDGTVEVDTTAVEDEDIINVFEGDNRLLLFTPNAGSYLASVKINGTEMIENVVNNQLMIEAIEDNLDIDIRFKEYFTINILTQPRGTILANGNPVIANKVEVKENETVVFSITPNTGYIIKEVTYMGTALTITDDLSFNFTTAPVLQNGILEVNFDFPPDKIEVRLRIGNGGAIKINDITFDSDIDKTFDEGSEIIFNIIPKPGFVLLDLMKDGVSIINDMVGNTYTVASLEDDFTLEATFTQQQYILTIKDAETEHEVNLLYDANAEIKFYITPKTGWTVNTVNYNGQIEGPNESGVYIIDNFTSNGTLSVSYVLFTGFEPVNQPNTVRVYSGPSEIIVDGVEIGELLTVYSTTGAMIYNQKVTQEKTVIPVKSNSAYILKTEGRTFKVMI